MNQVPLTPDEKKVAQLLQVTAETLRVELAKKRAQRETERLLEAKKNQIRVRQSTPVIIPTVTPIKKPIDTKVTGPERPTFDIPPLNKPAETQSKITPPSPTEIKASIEDIDLDFINGAHALPHLDFNISQPKSAEKPKFTKPPETPLTKKSMIYATQQRENVVNLLKNSEFPEHVTTWSVLRSIAIIQSQEEQWDTLKIHEISIPVTEVSLWSSFFKIFTQTTAVRSLNHPFEKGDTFELKVPGFHMFNITRIRKSEKASLTFCVVQSKLHPEDATFIFEVLVRLPIRAWGMLEIYRNRSTGPELINSWKITEVYLKRAKDMSENEKKWQKGGILWILGL